MTTPFKALNPFSPRYIEINYVAPDGGCCAISSSGGGTVFPDDPIPPETFFQYFFNSISFGTLWMMWIQNPVDPTERIFVTEFLTDIEGPIDITSFFYLPEVQSVPGAVRKVFFTQVFSTSSGTFERAYQTSFSDQTGAMSLEAWNDVPAYDGLGGWYGPDDVQMVVIENYLNSIATFNVVETPFPPDA